MNNQEKIDRQFNAVVNIIRSLPQDGKIIIDIPTKLRFYALFKVATMGKNTSHKPPIWKPVERLKWNAWYSRGNLDSYSAKHMYIREFGETMKELRINNKLIYTEEDIEFIKKIKKEDIQVLMEDLDKECKTDLDLALKKELDNFISTYV